LKGDKVDPGQLAFEAGVGAAAGALAGGAARYARYGSKTSAGNRFTQFRQGYAAENPTSFKLGLLARDKAIMGSDEYLITQILPRAGARKLFGTTVGKAVGKAVARRVFSPTFIALTGGAQALKIGGVFAGNALFNSGSGGSPGAAQSSADIQQTGWNDVSAGHKGVYGEFVHWQLYINALRAGGRPIPNNPNNVLATF
jgi:hypothetical protein